MTLFLTDLDRGRIDIRPIPKMGRDAVDSNELFIDDLRCPRRIAWARKGGLRVPARRPQPGADADRRRGDGHGPGGPPPRLAYANERVVFGRPIGQNQGLQFPLADALIQLDAAELMARKAAWLYDRGLPCGREANAAKYLCAEAGF